MVMCHKVLYL